MAVLRPLSERSACSSLCVSALRKPRLNCYQSLVRSEQRFYWWQNGDIWKTENMKVSLTISTNIYLCRFYTKPSPKSCQPLLRSIKGKNPKAPGPLRDWLFCMNEVTLKELPTVHSMFIHTKKIMPPKILCFQLTLIFSVTKSGPMSLPKITTGDTESVACLYLFWKAPGIQGGRCSRTLPGAITHAVIPMTHTCSSETARNLSAKNDLLESVIYFLYAVYTHVPIFFVQRDTDTLGFILREQGWLHLRPQISRGWNMLKYAFCLLYIYNCGLPSCVP